MDKYGRDDSAPCGGYNWIMRAETIDLEKLLQEYDEKAEEIAEDSQLEGLFKHARKLVEAELEYRKVHAERKEA